MPMRTPGSLGISAHTCQPPLHDSSLWVRQGVLTDKHARTDLELGGHKHRLDALDAGEQVLQAQARHEDKVRREERAEAERAAQQEAGGMFDVLVWTLESEL